MHTTLLPSPSPTSSPIQFLSLSTAQIMLVVMLATIPGILISTWFFGYGLLLNIGFAMTVSVVCESLVALISHRQPREILTDNSGLVTALLFALTIPPETPWWQRLGIHPSANLLRWDCLRQGIRTRASRSAIKPSFSSVMNIFPEI